MTKLAHPRPERMAMAACAAEGDCACTMIAKAKDTPPWLRLNRMHCEHRYKAAVREIIEAILPGAIDG